MKGKGSGGKGSSKGKRGKVQCRGCWKMKAPEEMALSKPFCYVCSRALDNIAKACKAQGEMDFWQENRFHDQRPVQATYLHTCVLTSMIVAQAP